MKRAKYITELKLELTMRKRVWGNIKDRQTGKPVFSESKGHQERYNTLEEIFDLFNRMTDQDLAELIAKIERREKAEGKQTSLFV